MICERVLGRSAEALDYGTTIICDDLHEWVGHYNTGRPHMSLGPGLPQPPAAQPVALHTHRHRLPEHQRVVASPILSGLHHEYGLGKKAT